MSLGALRENLNKVKASCLDTNINRLEARFRSSTLYLYLAIITGNCCLFLSVLEHGKNVLVSFACSFVTFSPKVFYPRFDPIARPSLM